ncbi:lysophospholipid acyltransferase 5-like [Acanthaster planci]|uniref:Lysophospholipid acyltransferase 5 n=1 Tax=Acanthaster planci TaxID=133434 RepID=A0A8B7ZET7_ACAPL|nr:lysophospholipid acyltransferase 5-like [Acanthaster planci]
MEGSGNVPPDILPVSGTSWRGVDLPAFFYLLTMLACYPLAYISRTYLHGQPSSVKHAYFILCGLILMFANFGYGVIHSAISVLANYALLVTVGGSQLSVVLSFIFNMAYLLIAYVLLSTDGYDLIWTTPHCILTVKMAGTAFDLYDGHKKEEVLSLEQKKLNIKRAPSLLELAGYTYFIGGCFAAPIFSIRPYLEFTEGKLADNDRALPPDCIRPALGRLGVGCVYLVLYTLLSPVFSNAYLMSPEFASLSFLSQMFVVMCWGKVAISKYSVIFLFTEGVCIMSGFGYNGRDKNGNVLWDRCISYKPMQFELATTCRELVKSFNISTNTWVSRYVYKRLKFLNNRNVSQLAALLFLAVWHGFYVGYYVGFLQEFVVFFIEAKVVEISQRYPPLARAAEVPPIKVFLWVCFKAWNLFVMSFALVPFVLLRWRRTRLVSPNGLSIRHCHWERPQYHTQL